MKKYLLIIITVLLGIAIAMTQWNSCEEKKAKVEMRAAIDIGSGATNMKIAEVDIESEKIITQIFEKSIPVPYQKHLEQSSEEGFDEEVMLKGLESLRVLKDIADEYQVKKVVAVATAAFRKARNAETFAKRIFEETGIEVRVINQDEEGVLAFRGALATTTAEAENTITWDIGGGSMQLTTLTEAGTYIVEKGKTASIPFKNRIIQSIKQADIRTVQTPNPMTAEQIADAVLLAEEIAEGTDSYIKAKLLHPKTKIIAVGSLFNYGIRPLTNGEPCSQQALEKAIVAMRNKEDANLPGGSLAEVAVSNPVLVLGFMKNLGMESVDIISVNNTDGALTFPPYWQ